MEQLEKYLLLMFAIKREGKFVDFEHVKEKAERDLKADDEAIKKALANLINKGLIIEKNNLYAITTEGRRKFFSSFNEWKKELANINKTWTTVYDALNYYNKVADVILKYCKDRHVGFYCTFTEQHFFRRQFKGKYITINSKEDLMKFIQMFCIDVIPCVHRIGIEKPDWLVIDLDAGEKIAFNEVKEVAKVCYEVMEKMKLKPAMKFSGSRGIQLWSLIKDIALPPEWKPIPMLRERRRKNFFTLFVDIVRLIQYKVDKEMPGITTSIVYKKEERENKILVDWSCLKPNGLVRAPYGMHHKTGLVSVPLDIKEIDDFSPEQAEPSIVIKRYEEKGDEFKLQESDAKYAINELLNLKDEIARMKI